MDTNIKWNYVNGSLRIYSDLCHGELKATTYCFIIFTILAIITTMITTIVHVLIRRRTRKRAPATPYESFLWFIFSELCYVVMVTVSNAVNIGTHCEWLKVTHRLCKFLSWATSTAYMTSNFLFALIFLIFKVTLQFKRSESPLLSSSHVHFIAIAICMVTGLLMIPHVAFTKIIDVYATENNHTVREISECQFVAGKQIAPLEVTDFFLGTITPYLLAFTITIFIKPRPFFGKLIPRDSRENIVEDVCMNDENYLNNVSFVCLLGSLLVHFVFQTPLRIVSLVSVFSTDSHLPYEIGFYTGSASWRYTVYFLMSLPFAYCLSFLPLSRLLSTLLDRVPFICCAKDLKKKPFAGFRRQAPIHSKEHRNSDFRGYN